MRPQSLVHVDGELSVDRTRHERFLDYKVKGKVGDVTEPLASNHSIQQFPGIGETEVFDGFHQLGQGEVIHAIYIAGSERDRGDTAG